MSERIGLAVNFSIRSGSNMKRIAILGSTGSIGTATLEVATLLKDEIQVVALAAKSQIDLLEKQAKLFHPKTIAVYDEDKGKILQKRLPHIEVLLGLEGILTIAKEVSVDLVVSAISGTLGLMPTFAALQAGKDVALANKEALVSGGRLITDLAKRQGAHLLPVDSEHSALFQCLQGGNEKEVKRLILTASGGPFHRLSLDELKKATLDNALKHPTWQMGLKNTVDSSTLMNKGLEIIEAHFLFDVPYDKIDVAIHPQSIVHSLVEWADNSILAQMSVPTMHLPIQYALTYPKRQESLVPPFDFTSPHSLDFFPPDMERFRCLKIAIKAGKAGMSYPIFMNAANEVLVERFSKREISWWDIGEKLQDLMDAHTPSNPQTIEEILNIDREAKSSVHRT